MWKSRTAALLSPLGPLPPMPGPVWRSAAVEEASSGLSPFSTASSTGPLVSPDGPTSPSQPEQASAASERQANTAGMDTAGTERRAGDSRRHSPGPLPSPPARTRRRPRQHAADHSSPGRRTRRPCRRRDALGRPAHRRGTPDHHRRHPGPASSRAAAGRGDRPVAGPAEQAAATQIQAGHRPLSVYDELTGTQAASSSTAGSPPPGPGPPAVRLSGTGAGGQWPQLGAGRGRMVDETGTRRAPCEVARRCCSCFAGEEAVRSRRQG
ncbi:hypothetical protein QFZ82_001359 [Streptomyces sp. V4I23]|nr:hypothetical protein [Streptomyces sp. V4I23]